MAVTDPIADYLTRLRNAQMAGHTIVEIPASNIKRGITEILYDQGFIRKYTYEDSKVYLQGIIKIAIKYDALTKKPIIREMKRVSRPGLRQYKKSDEIPTVINGYGIAVVSTSKGLMTDKAARAANVGGEVLFYIY
jgi:small subunit ribosomal protein S8